MGCENFTSKIVWPRSSRTDRSCRVSAPAVALRSFGTSLVPPGLAAVGWSGAFLSPLTEQPAMVAMKMTQAASRASSSPLAIHLSFHSWKQTIDGPPLVLLMLLLRQEFHADIARFSRTVSIFVEFFHDNLVTMNRFHLAIVTADWSPDSYDITESRGVLDHRPGLSNIPDDANDFQLAQVKPLERRQILARPSTNFG